MRVLMAGLGALIALAGCCGRAEKSQDPANGRLPEPVIDVHAHLFNARDLPIAGILVSQRNVSDKLANTVSRRLPTRP